MAKNSVLRNSLWPVLIATSAIGAVSTHFEPSGSPIRALCVFWFLLVCPGMVIVPFLRVQDRVSEIMLAVALSIAIDMLLAEVMVLNKLWSPWDCLLVLAGYCLAASILQLAALLYRTVRNRANLAEVSN